MTKFNAVNVARRVIGIEAKGLAALADNLDANFSEVVDGVKSVSGHIVLTGVGKSGHVARKIAATLASTGTPSLYIHPTEASHGDMGMITRNDCVIALSRSGETKELADIIQFCKRAAVPLIAMTCKKNSALGKAGDYLLHLPDTAEACTITGAPTTSTTLQMALGDALAVALLESRGFTAGDFKAFHPGGTLGAQLQTAQDLMHVGDRLPLVADSDQMETALSVMSEKGFGCVGVTDKTGILCGIITDGDIRRNLDKNLPNANVKTVMTKEPKTITPDILAAEALNIMTARAPKVMQVFVLLDEKPVGIIHMHDLLRAGIV
jgi:arabinose-5-phosphate isomerase